MIRNENLSSGVAKEYLLVLDLRGIEARPLLLATVWGGLLLPDRRLSHPCGGRRPGIIFRLLGWGDLPLGADGVADVVLGGHRRRRRRWVGAAGTDDRSHMSARSRALISFAHEDAILDEQQHHDKKSAQVQQH